jgi:hypothetical protein
VIPLPAIVAAEQAFPQSGRAQVRALGMEAIGRFKPAKVTLTSGSSATVYSLSALEGTTVVEYICVVPVAAEPIWGKKVNQVNEDRTKIWGKWELCDSPTDLAGFSSVSPRDPSEKQRAWWDRSAGPLGLDPTQELSRKNFQVLPFLVDTGTRLYR